MNNYSNCPVCGMTPILHHYVKGDLRAVSCSGSSAAPHSPVRTGRFTTVKAALKAWEKIVRDVMASKRFENKAITQSGNKAISKPYVAYGEEWTADMMKLSKSDLVSTVRMTSRSLDAITEKYKAIIVLINKLEGRTI